MSPHNDASIVELENKVESIIPEGCKQLLINFGGKRLDKRTFVRIVNEGFSEEMTIDSVTSIGGIIYTWDNVKDVFDIQDHKIMHFGETLGSPVICIGLSPENYGKIYVFDFDFGLTQIAESLKDFLESLE